MNGTNQDTQRFLNKSFLEELGVTTFTMIHVPGSTFPMGAAGDDPDAYDWNGEKGQHTVELDAFHIGQYPVTQALYKAVMENQNPSEFIDDNRPVEQVSWFDAAVFCNKLNEILDLEPCYYVDAAFQDLFGKTADGYELPNDGAVFIRPSSKGYRLPTEAEWEYAARGGKEGVTQNFKYAGSNARSGKEDEAQNFQYAGSNKLKEVGWFDTNSHQETKPVGMKAPNILGLYDMSGNVWEWCQDWFDSNYYDDCAKKGTVKNPLGPDNGSNRVSRGGSWDLNPQYCRVAYRYLWPPDTRNDNIGFRLCLASSEVDG
jgi:formylglycine-generating enzyme required for sulfatase activity